MVTKIMEWVSITALLLVVTWRPSSNYQIALDFVVCAGALMVVLASLLHSSLSNTTSRLTVTPIADPTARVTVKL